jgi:uncharacterized protein
MRMNEVIYDDSKPVEGYGPGFFRIGGAVHTGAVLLLPSGVTNWGGYDDLTPLLNALSAIDVLLMGTGDEIAHLPVAARVAFDEAGLGVELMATPTACRTYNVLLSEGRRIGAALLPVAKV